MSEPKGVNGYLITQQKDGSWCLINFHGESVAGSFATEAQAIAVAEVFVDETSHAQKKTKR